MRDIFLHGRLATEFGPHFRLEVASPAEAVRALIAQFPKFRAALQPGSFQLVKGEIETGIDLGQQELGLPMSPKYALHLKPVIEGAGGGGSSGGTVKVVLGVVLIAAAVILAIPSGGSSLAGLGAAMSATTVAGVSMTSVALFGATMLFTGVSQLMSPSPKPQQAHEGVTDRPSFLFQGVTNTAVQGCPVPLVYGRFRVGSVVGSSSIRAEQIAIPGAGIKNGFIWSGASG